MVFLLDLEKSFPLSIFGGRGSFSCNILVTLAFSYILFQLSQRLICLSIIITIAVILTPKIFIVIILFLYEFNFFYYSHYINILFHNY